MKASFSAITKESLYSRIKRKSDELVNYYSPDGQINYGFGPNCLMIDDNVRLKSGLEFKLPLNNSAYECIDMISKKPYDFRDVASSTNMVTMNPFTWNEIVQSAECVLYPNSNFNIDNALQTINMFADKHWDKPDGTKHTAYEMLLKFNNELDIKTAYYLKDENFAIEGIPETWVVWKATSKGKHLTALRLAYVRNMFQVTYPEEEPPGFTVSPKKKVKKITTTMSGSKVTMSAPPASQPASAETRSIPGVEQDGTVTPKVKSKSQRTQNGRKGKYGKQ